MVIDWLFNPYKFYEYGYNTSFMPESVVSTCKQVISETKWIGDKPRFASWSILPESTTDELWYEELVRGRMSYSNAPTVVRNLANEIIDNQFFDPLRDLLVKKQHSRYNGIRNIVPCSMGLWDRQEDIDWHNDISDTSDFFILLYINDYQQWNQEWGGQIKVGKQTKFGDVAEVERLSPVSGTFVMINNTNPLFHHAVQSAGDKDRFTFGFRYKIV